MPGFQELLQMLGRGAGQAATGQLDFGNNPLANLLEVPLNLPGGIAMGGRSFLGGQGVEDRPVVEQILRTVGGAAALSQGAGPFIALQEAFAEGENNRAAQTQTPQFQQVFRQAEARHKARGASDEEAAALASRDLGRLFPKSRGFTPGVAAFDASARDDSGLPLPSEGQRAVLPPVPVGAQVEALENARALKKEAVLQHILATGQPLDILNALDIKPPLDTENAANLAARDAALAEGRNSVVTESISEGVRSFAIHPEDPEIFVGAEAISQALDGAIEAAAPDPSLRVMNIPLSQGADGQPRAKLKFFSETLNQVPTVDAGGSPVTAFVGGQTGKVRSGTLPRPPDTSTRNIVQGDGTIATELFDTTTGARIRVLEDAPLRSGTRVETDPTTGRTIVLTGDAVDTTSIGPSEAKDARDRIDNADSGLRMIRQMRAALRPENVGAVGGLRNVLSGIGQQADTLAYIATVEKAARREAQFSDGFTFSAFFDKNLDTVTRLGNALAFAMARSRDKGRLSDVEVNFARRDLGVDQWLTGVDALNNGLSLFEQQIGQGRGQAQSRLAGEGESIPAVAGARADQLFGLGWPAEDVARQVQLEFPLLSERR